MAEVLPKMSLIHQGSWGKPMCADADSRVLDTQVPNSDIYLLISKGDTPEIQRLKAHSQGRTFGMPEGMP